MKKILIIYPHFPPSNLAGVHRPRLFAQHLPAFGWEPVILTVHERYYEEAPDYDLVNLLPPELRIEKAGALPVTRPRVVGDLGLRAFFSLYKKAKRLIRDEGMDFLYIPIPSFYCALLGRLLRRATGIRYGIDYIDPWVHPFPGSETRFSRHWWSAKLAAVLEPIAVKHASLVTGVAPGYFEPVLQRNPALQQTAVAAAMPYGGEPGDLEKMAGWKPEPYLFHWSTKQKIVYAGALLPKAVEPLEAMLQAVAENRPEFEDVEFHFIGTGRTADDPEGHRIKKAAQRYGLWQEVVFEHPKRIPYLDVLVHLRAADGVLVLGSTEPHYTPSKVYQAVLAGRPVFALLHTESTAVGLIRTAGAGVVLDFNGEGGLQVIRSGFPAAFRRYRGLVGAWDPAAVDTTVLEQYSARSVTRQLAALLDQVLDDQTKTHD